MLLLGTDLMPTPERSQREVSTEADAGPNPRKDYVAAFRHWEPIIEAGMREPDTPDKPNTPERQRQAQLDAAESCLVEIDIEHDPVVESLVDKLEGKLREMLDALRGNWRGAEAPESAKPLLNPELALKLARPVAQRERRFLFRGRIESVLFEYRDEGRALTKVLCNAQLERMRRHARLFADEARDLVGHLLVAHVAADSGLRESIEDAVTANAEIVTRLQTITTSTDASSLLTLLRANGDQVRNQFTVACATVCLTTYGNVAVDHLRDLLEVKSVYYMARRGTAFNRTHAGKADLRNLTRRVDKALGLAQASARTRKLPIEDVLALFKLLPDLGRSPVRERPRPVDQGLAGLTYSGEL